MQNFEIINKLGDGAYSEVFKVRRKIDSKIYALKKVKLKNLKEIHANIIHFILSKNAMVGLTAKEPRRKTYT